jgi:hypothetical protein
VFSGGVSVMFLIVTDKLMPPEGPPGSIDPVTGVRWGIGVRFYYCGEEGGVPKLDYAIGSAMEFSSPEAAETRLMVLCVIEPNLIDHAHVVEKESAWAQWHADLKDFEERSGLNSVPKDRGGCF